MNSVEFATMMKPKAVVISDSDQGEMEARYALLACSCEVVGQSPFICAETAITEGPLPDIVLVNLTEADSNASLAGLEALSAATARAHCPLVIAAPVDVLDVLPQSVWTASDALLTDASHAEFAAAISIAVGGRRHRLNDVGREVDAARLQRLADEVGRIARTLASLSAEAPDNSDAVSDVRPTFTSEPMHLHGEPSASEVRAVIRMRRLRERFFDRDLFADPAWDMLLDLMAARIERVQVAVSSLCIAACVPSTTALRWIKTMTDVGLFDRVADPDDGRRIFIRLSEGAAGGMAKYFAAMRAANEQAV